MTATVAKNAHVWERDGQVLDPSCGGGNIVTTLRSAGVSAWGTDIKQRVPDGTDEFTAREGISPTYDEMAAAVDLKSKSGVFRLVEALDERGRIHRMPNRVRSIVVVDGKAGDISRMVFPDHVEAKLSKMCAETGAARSSVISMAVAEFVGAGRP